MQLTPTMQRYVVHWGEMGSRWGMNRSVAQIHALLFLSEHPLNADEIGSRAARMAGNRPPRKPIISAQTSPCVSSAGVT